MAFTEGSSDGYLRTGDVEVLIIAAPTEGRRVIKLITICNNDTEDAVISIILKNNGAYRTLWKGTLNPGDTLYYDDLLVLDNNGKSIVAILDADRTTYDIDFVTSFGDVTE